MVEVISPKQAQEWLLAGEAILIDVREPDEFRVQHIAQAQSIPLSLIQEGSIEVTHPPGIKVIGQCLKGKRGETGCAILSQRSSDNSFYNIEGGIEAWIAAGLPVIGQPPAKLSIFRQVQIIVGSLILLMVLLGFAGMTFGFVIAGLFGGALAFAGITGWCGLAMLLQKMPWNK